MLTIVELLTQVLAAVEAAINALLKKETGEMVEVE